MPNNHKTPFRGIRGATDELVTAFDTAARQARSDRSSKTRELWAWYAGLPGATLPERPCDQTEAA